MTFSFSPTRAGFLAGRSALAMAVLTALSGCAALAPAPQAVAPGVEAPAAWTQEQFGPLGLALHRHLKAGAVHAHLLHKA